MPRKSPTSSSARRLKGWGFSATGWWSLTLGFVEAAVADESAESGGPRDVKTGETVEEAKFENVGAEEAPERADDGGENREARAACLLLLDEEIGEGIYLRDVAGKRGERVVMEVAAQGRDRAVADHFFMDELVAAPAGAGSLDEAQAEVGIPVAMGDPAVDEPDLAGEARAGERREIRAREEGDEVGAEGGGDLFVGVEAERPGLGGEGEGGVFRVAEALPRQVMDVGAGRAGEGFGVVGGGVEGDDDFRGPALHAGEAAREIGGLVFGDDDDGKGKSFNHGWTQMDTDTEGGESKFPDK